MDPEDIRELREEIFPYWRGQTLEDQAAAAIAATNGKEINGRQITVNEARPKSDRGGGGGDRRGGGGGGGGFGGGGGGRRW